MTRERRERVYRFLFACVWIGIDYVSTAIEFLFPCTREKE